MGTLRVASGRKWNLFERGTLTVSSAHAQLGADRLKDGRPNRPYRTAAAVADLVFTNDGNILVNGGLDSWPSGIPTGWIAQVTGAGSVVAAEGTTKQAGANSARLTTGNVGGAIAQIVQIFEARAGEARRVEVYLHGSGGAQSVEALLQNMDSGNFLNTSGAWVPGPTPWGWQTPASFAQTAKDYVVESFAASGKRDIVRMALYLRNITQNTTAYVDEAYDYPAFNCASLHGIVGVPAWQNVQVRSSTDAFAAVDTLEATFAKPIQSPAAYVLLPATVSRRWSRIKFEAQPLDPIEIGEATVCQVVQPTQHYDTPRGGSSQTNHVRTVTPGGELHLFKRSRFPARNRLLRYWFADPSVAVAQAMHDNAKELFYDRPEGDAYPGLLITDTDLPEVLYARFLSSWAWMDRQNDYISDVTVEAQEMPFASSAQ